MTSAHMNLGRRRHCRSELSTDVIEKSINLVAVPEPATSEQVLTAARQVLAHRVRRCAALTSPRSVREYLTVKLGALDYEIFGLILVDSRHKVIEYVELFRGTIDGASVHPREVVKIVLARGAAGVVLVHNHPSAVKDQSHADEAITRRIRD